MPKIFLITGTEHRIERSFPQVEIVHITFASRRFDLFTWGWRVRRLLRALHRRGQIRWVNLHWPPLIQGLLVPPEIPLLLTAHTTYLGMSGKFYPAKHYDSPWSETELRIKMWMERRIFANVDRVIALTEQGRQEVLSYGFKGRIAVIPNGVDLRQFTPDEGTPKDIDVLFCGRIEVRKGSRPMVELCKALIRDRPDIRICIVGYGDDESWVRSNLEACSRNVRFAGKTKFEEMIGYYRRSRVYASTSYYEGLPGTCLEAMAMQLPVVAWDFLFYDKLVVNGVTGHLVASNDIPAMSRSILALLANESEASRMGRAGRKLLESRYDWALLAKEVLGEMRD